MSNSSTANSIYLISNEAVISNINKYTNNYIET